MWTLPQERRKGNTGKPAEEPLPCGPGLLPRAGVSFHLMIIRKLLNRCQMQTHGDLLLPDGCVTLVGSRFRISSHTHFGYHIHWILVEKNILQYRLHKQFLYYLLWNVVRRVPPVLSGPVFRSVFYSRSLDFLSVCHYILIFKVSLI